MTTERRRDPVSTRRLNLGDSIVLIAAIAVFLGLARWSWADPPSDAENLTFRSGQINQGTCVVSAFPNLATEILTEGPAAASFAVIILRLRSPRPRWGRLVRQPGWIACGAGLLGAVATCGIEHVRVGVEAVHVRRLVPAGVIASNAKVDLPLFSHNSSVSGCLGVIIGWLGLAGAGALRPERSVIDRLGRLVGLGWIISPLAQLGYGSVRTFWP